MSKKILIVDDEAHIRMLLSQTLEEFEDHDVEILTAENGQKGLELIISETPELVLLDVMMPLKNGFEVCHDAKTIHKSKSFIMILTAKGQEFDKNKGLESGADMYLTKPFDPDVILEKAKEVLGISF
jgi:two-component system, OmpR family, alkaline phosphatase synthesis response regulator PhoP